MRTIKIKLALLSAAVACIAGVWAPSASANTTSATAPAACTTGATGYWTGYWTWTGQTWKWTWIWYSCTGGGVS